MWLAAYGRAWETRDAEAAVELFTADIEYYETPLDTPFRGRDELRDYWARATGSQDGITRVEFASDGPCRMFREWWHESERSP